MLDVLSFLYASVGLIALMGFAPQVLNLLRATGQSKAISISTWVMWSYTATVTLLYVLYVNGDTPLIVVSAINCTGHWLILSLVTYNRYFRFRDEDIVIVHKPKQSGQSLAS